QPRGYCKTQVKYREDEDTFELGCQFKLWFEERTTQVPDLVIDSSYFVTREGELRGIRANLNAVFPNGLKLEGKIDGQVRGGYFAPVVSLHQPWSYAHP